MSNCKMDIFVFRAAERTFQSKNILIYNLLCQDSPCGPLLFFNIKKRTVFEWKAFEKFADQQREFFPFPRI